MRSPSSVRWLTVAQLRKLALQPGGDRELRDIRAILQRSADSHAVYIKSCEAEIRNSKEYLGNVNPTIHNISAALGELEA